MLFRKVYGVDLGTSTLKVYSYQKDKVYQERNMVAVKDKKRALAVGDEAYEMFEKAPDNIEVASPMAYGMIADIVKAEVSLYSLIKKIHPYQWFGSIMYFAVPADLTQIEKRAYNSMANGGWLQNNKVRIVEKPIADAIAMDIPIRKTKGSMVVNIGAQSTEISVIADGKVIISKVLKLGGRQIDMEICSEINRVNRLQIGTRTASRLKTSIGELYGQKEQMRKVIGIDTLSGLPREAVVSSEAVNAAIARPITAIGNEMKTFLERTPPQIAYSILKEGIYLAGGSTRLKNIDKFLADFTGYGVCLSQMHETCTIRGVEKMIKDRYLQEWAVPVKQKKM
ncbi:MAG: rod shape-determining protein [Lachnospiraceae bacterium]|nr:rod shape-determining protein [Lachnospiraceae bacterium]MCI9545316.1 rod shape-determining protein [Lachnospiraceae bacterium]